MSVVSSVRVGIAAAQAAIDAVERHGVDRDTLLLRLGVVKMLELHQADLTADDEEKLLLDAYRAWISAALRYFEPDPQANIREYARATAILSVEIELTGVHVPAPKEAGATTPTVNARAVAGLPPRG